MGLIDRSCGDADERTLVQPVPRWCRPPASYASRAEVRNLWRARATPLVSTNQPEKIGSLLRGAPLSSLERLQRRRAADERVRVMSAGFFRGFPAAQAGRVPRSPSKSARGLKSGVVGAALIVSGLLKNLLVAKRGGADCLSGRATPPRRAAQRVRTRPSRATVARARSEGGALRAALVRAKRVVILLG
jgi:hypothetical protein